MKTFVLAGDAAYTVPIETMVKSILYHHQQVKIYIIHQNIPTEWFRDLQQSVAQLESTLEEIQLPDEVIDSNWRTFHHISPIAFARYWISQYITEDRVVYLDCDMVVHQPLDELFDLDLEDNMIAAVRDANGTGFNSGMMLIDNAKWRTHNILEKLLATTSEQLLSDSNPQIKGDQDILNMVIGDAWYELPQLYNLQVGHDVVAFYSNWTAQFADKSLPYVVHYTTEVKPWNGEKGYRYRDLWFEYHALTMEQIRQHYDRRYDVQRVYDHYEVNVFTFTDSQDFLYMDELAQALPNVAFHIGAWTQMGDKLLSLKKYPNVSLYPEIVGVVIDELVDQCDAYLDHHFGSPQQWITDRFTKQHKPVLAFDRTSKESSVAQMIPSDDVNEMVKTIQQLADPLISVIVPVYKVENYLEVCVTSILNQSYCHLEVILVNDGSPDNSADLCQAFVQQDHRVRYLEKENTGVADARNLGIEHATGTYLFFVDSDDWLEWNALEELVSAMRRFKSKMVVASYTRFEEAEGLFYRHIFDEQYYEKVYSKKELLEQLPILEGYDITYQTCWGILYHCSMFRTVRFPSGRLNEDIGTMYKLFMQTDDIVYLNKPLYFYRIRPNSYTTQRLTAKQMQYDMELRMERIAFLSLNGYDLTHYRHQQVFYFKDWYNGTKDDELLADTEIVRRFHESIFLLEQG